MEAEHNEYMTLQGQFDQLQDDYLRLQEDYVRLRAETDVMGVLPDPPVSISKLPLLSYKRQGQYQSQCQCPNSNQNQIRNQTPK